MVLRGHKKIRAATDWHLARNEGEIREKYLPPNYRDKIYEQPNNLKQDNMIVAEYMQKFDELKTRAKS